MTNDNPLTPEQRHGGKHLACRDIGHVDCGFEMDAEELEEARDAMMRHYIDEHPGHKVDDALTLALSERYRM